MATTLHENIVERISLETAGLLLAVVLLLAIAFLLLKSEKSHSLWGQEQNPAASRGGKK